MAQWGQPGFQYPMQTGFQQGQPQFQQGQPQFQQQNPQFQQQGNPQFQQQPMAQGFGQQTGGIIPQRTGFPGIQPPQPGMQPQMTGFPGSGMMQAQPTGFAGAGGGYRAPPPPPPMPPLPSQFQGQNHGSGFLQPQQQQPNRFLSPSPGLGGPGLSAIAPQQTGFPAARPLQPQMTGFVDPKLQMMSSSFLPMNLSMPYGAGGAPQLPSQQLPGGMNLQQSFQNYNQEVKGTTAPKVPWALSKAEKKSYDQIFRAWDKDNSGFISGQIALEVFGQSGLGKDDLARIWTLADVDDRGMLNLPEFHVAMGLIYRRLNGNEIPEQLPAELVPPSARDLDSSVNFLKDVLKNETRARSPSGLDSPISRLKDRSFHGNGSTIGSGRDATIYKHEDSPPPGGLYQSRKRHVDRDQVRSRNDVGPSADLQDMKNMLANTAHMLDRSASEETSKTAEDEALEQEMDDLRYRVKCVTDDLDYLSRGPRTASKDEDRRKLERELLTLTHERVPELERRIKAREERRDREKRQWARDRDRTNDRPGRYDDRDRDDQYSSRYDNRDRDRDRDRPYSRGSYRDRDRDDGYRRRSPSRDGRDRYERPRSPVARSPPPAPPPAPPQTSISIPPPAPRQPASPAPGKSMAQMTKEERQAEVQRRIEARKAALGIVATPSATPVDTSVEDRLVQEKKEAEEKVRIAEKEAEERETQRRERLEREKAAKEDSVPPPAAPTPTAPAAAPAPTKAAPTPPALRAKTAPPPPKPRGAPPPPASRATPVAPKPPAPITAPPAPPPAPEVDPEEEAFRARQDAIRKQREAREEALRKMEEEARVEEEAFQAKIQALKNRATTPAPVAAPPPVEAQPPAPPVAVAPAVSPPTEKSSTNPFSRLLREGGAAASPPAASSPSATVSSTNPWATKPATPTQPPAISAPTPPPASRISRTTTPVPVKSPYQTAPTTDDDDWDVIKEIDADDDDSSDDDVGGNRAQRLDIANKLFKGLLPSTPATPISPPSASTPSAASSVPAAPAPPPAPAAPAAPPPPAATTAPPAVEGRNALLSAIQSGARLRRTETVDKSGPGLSGKVLGDTAPPPHINAAPRVPSPDLTTSIPVPAALDETSVSNTSSHRQSVDWYSGLAAESQAGTPGMERLPSTTEENEVDEPRAPTPIQVPDIQVQEAPDTLADIDKTAELRVRSLYAFEADGPDDLSFGPDMIINAHPSKSGADWWYGTLVASGKSGMFPQTYVQPLINAKAKAIYTYEGTTPEELTFSEGETITVIDNSESEWWKAEQGGMVFIVPAAYLEIIEDVQSAASANLMKQDDYPPQLPSVETVTESPDEVQRLASIPVDASQDDSVEPPGNSKVVESNTNAPEQPEPESEDDDESMSGDSDYMSFESSEDEGPAYPETKEEREARANERRLVLQAAGLILKQDAKPPPRPPRRRKSSKAKRRPPPLAPQRLTTTSSAGSSQSQRESRDLPPPPSLELAPGPDSTQYLNDAFDRYETFRHRNPNRLSVASFESGSAPPTSPTGTIASVTPSVSQREGESGSGRSHSGFLHFLGRSRTPVESEKRSTLMISAPILHTPETSSGGGDMRSLSPAFGSSWASLVDKTALEGIPATERKRQEAIFELVSTESAYVQDLQLIVELFYRNMLSLLDDKAITVIFANVEDILITNTTFMSALEERQKECRLYIDHIGDVLQSHMSNMAVYLEYCVNQSHAIKVLQSLRDSMPGLAAQLQKLRDDPSARSLDLSSYLLIPMQRITRYPLLIKQILHYTELGAEHDSIASCIEISEKILDHINETIREQEGREVLKSISEYLWIGQGRLDLTAPTRNMGQRKLLREGTLSKAKSGRRLHGYLCSDILVLTDAAGKSLYRMPISLAEAQVKIGSDDVGFSIGLPYPRGGESVALRANSVRDCQLWMQAIESASRKCREAERKALARRQQRAH